MGFGTGELIAIVLMIFLLFGVKSLPKFARSLVEARKELKKGMEDLNAETLANAEKLSDDDSEKDKPSV